MEYNRREALGLGLAGAAATAMPNNVRPFIFARAKWNARKQLAKGGGIEIPAGDHIIKDGNLEIELTRDGIGYEGAGSSVSKLVFENGGLIINSPSVVWPVRLEGFSILTRQAGKQKNAASTACQIKYPQIPSGVFKTVVARDIIMHGADLYNDWWIGGFALTNCWNVTMDDCQQMGPPATFDNMKYGVLLQGQSTAPVITNLRAFNLDTGLQIKDQTEGLRLTDSDFVGVNVGIKAKTNQGRPGMFIERAHFNAKDAGIIFRNRAQTWITDSLFYRHPGGEKFIGAWGTAVTDTTIRDNQFFGINDRSGGIGVSLTRHQATRTRGNTFDYFEIGQTFGGTRPLEESDNHYRRVLTKTV